MKTLSLGLTIALLVLQPGSSIADDHLAFFSTYCVRCHGGVRQEANLRLDMLASPNGETSERWSQIADMIEAGEMPPLDEPRPPAEAIRQVTRWISGELARVTQPVAALRRLNRTEYEYTVHDLLGIDTPLKDLLPEDSSVQGFDNVAGGLGISSILMERYLEAADVAFEGVITRIKPLPAETRRAVLMEQDENIESVAQNKGGVIESEGAFIDFTPGWPPARIDPAHPIDNGIYRCRIAVWPHEPGDHRTLAVAVYVGPLFGDGERRLMGMFDVTGTPEEPRIIEFTARMAASQTMHILPWIFPEHVTWRDKGRSPSGRRDRLGGNLRATKPELSIGSDKETLWRRRVDSDG